MLRFIQSIRTCRRLRFAKLKVETMPDGRRFYNPDDDEEAQAYLSARWHVSQHWIYRFIKRWI